MPCAQPQGALGSCQTLLSPLGPSPGPHLGQSPLGHGAFSGHAKAGPPHCGLEEEAPPCRSVPGCGGISGAHGPGKGGSRVLILMLSEPAGTRLCKDPQSADPKAGTSHNSLLLATIATPSLQNTYEHHVP